MLGWGHNSRWVETRHCRPHPPQTRQTEEGSRQLQTHLPDIPPREVYERVIKNRLEYHCESKKVFPVCQAGFRRGRGVTDRLVKLGEHVGRAIGRRKVLLTCFFDISRVNDQVWHAKLLQKRDVTRSEFLATCTTTSDPSWATDQCRSGGRE